MGTYFSFVANWLAKWTGSHWALFGAAALVVVSLGAFGLEVTNISISIVTLLMLFVLQNTQNRDSAALHVKLDELVVGLDAAGDEVAGAESKTDDEIEELRRKND